MEDYRTFWTNVTSTRVLVTPSESEDENDIIDPVYNYGQPRAPAAELHLLPVPEVVDVPGLLQVMEVDPVVESLDCAVLLFSEEDVLKPTGAENSASATVHIKPELFEKIPEILLRFCKNLVIL